MLKVSQDCLVFVLFVQKAVRCSFAKRAGTLGIATNQHLTRFKSVLRLKDLLLDNFEPTLSG